MEEKRPPGRVPDQGIVLKCEIHPYHYADAAGDKLERNGRSAYGLPIYLDAGIGNGPDFDYLFSSLFWTFDKKQPYSYARG